MSQYLPGACGRERHKVQALGGFDYDTCRIDTCSLQREVAGAKQDANQVSAFFSLLSILQIFPGRLVGRALAGLQVCGDGSALAPPAGSLRPRALLDPRLQTHFPVIPPVVPEGTDRSLASLTLPQPRGMVPL